MSPLSRSYGVNLPSSFNYILPSFVYSLQTYRCQFLLQFFSYRFFTNILKYQISYATSINIGQMRHRYEPIIHATIVFNEGTAFYVAVFRCNETLIRYRMSTNFMFDLRYSC